MGRNIDLKELLGLGHISCPVCGHDLTNLDEVDMDCNTKSPQPNTLAVNVQCDNCEDNVDIRFNISLGL